MDDASAELEIIQQWGWDEWCHDGWDVMPKWRSLSETVNKIAFEGHADPAGAVLRLLCNGQLIAIGNYRWRTFRSCEHFGGDGSGNIPAARWRAVENVDPWEMLDLPKLELSKEAAAEWDWRTNSCTIASRSGDPANWFAAGYAEEWFSAWNIQVHCPSAYSHDKREADEPSPSASEAPPQPQTIGLVASERNKGGRPTIYKWEQATFAVALKWAEEGSWQPASQSDVKRALADWLAGQDQYPSESQMKERARWMFAEFQRRSGEAENLAA